MVIDSNGKTTITVNAILPGAATLTFSIENMELESKRAVGIDIEPESELITLTGISLDQTSLNLSSGNLQKLEVSFTPADATNQTVTWKLDNPKVATVDGNGLVTKICSGTTTIRVTSEEGRLIAACKIIVAKPTLIIKQGGKAVKSSVAVKIGLFQSYKKSITSAYGGNKHSQL